MHIEYGSEKRDIVSNGPFSICVKVRDDWNDFCFMDFPYSGKKLEVVDSFTLGDKTIYISTCDYDFIERFAPNYDGDLLCEIDYNDIHFTITK